MQNFPKRDPDPPGLGQGLTSDAQLGQGHVAQALLPAPPSRPACGWQRTTQCQGPDIFIAFGTGWEFLSSELHLRKVHLVMSRTILEPRRVIY